MKLQTGPITMALAMLAALGDPFAVVRAEPGYTVQQNVPVAMPDGTKLGADVYLPNTGEKFSAILVRTPYDKRGKEWLAKIFASNGYAVVVQDVRGMNASEGVFIPFIHEKQDGLDTLDWMTAKPWSDGKIGMWGSSYVAYCAVVLAPHGHPALKTIINMSGWGDGEKIAYPGGAMHLMLLLPWMLSSQIHGQGSFQDYDWPTAFRHVPVSEIPASMGVRSVPWEHAMKRSMNDPGPAATTMEGQYDKVDLPILHITGWNDFVARGTLDLVEHLDQAGRSAERPFRKLMVGPWRHDQIWLEETKVGDEDYGPQSRMGIPKVGEICVRWFDRWLKDEKNRLEEEPTVELYVMGSNEWRTFDRWPPRTVAFQPWYLDSVQGANSAAGDGLLSPALPQMGERDGFVFDPMDPAPTTGGVNFHFFLDNLGPKDQRPVENRSDVLVYTSAPMTKDVDVIGPLQVVLFASTEGKQTDFTAKLVEVRADGYARIIEDGIKRGPDAVDGRPVATMEPASVYRFTIDLGATAITIKQGHRLRVEVSSSNFPKYTRNPNTGENSETAAVFNKVRQTIFHSPTYPSHVLLPMVQP